ncbi:MAG: hypothetical protein CMG64_05105 [Candidatus Marinimicrobia bacterium]|nr:hypothetical protein [Candidatus Neomarinimicrobiota bacterium]|tara:strand:- start:2356 stop:2685 length:330 start_codon:yes stop_codon:yes gene_type:complete
MSDFLEQYLYKIKNESYIKKINNFFKKIINKSEKITKDGRLRIEIEKSKLEKKKKFMKLGRFIYNSFNKDNIVDFSYQDDFFKINDDIEKIDLYIDNLKSGKYEDNNSK